MLKNLKTWRHYTEITSFYPKPQDVCMPKQLDPFPWLFVLSVHKYFYQTEYGSTGEDAVEMKREIESLIQKMKKCQENTPR